MAAFELKQSAAMKKLPLRLLILIALALPTAAVAQRADPVYIEDRLNQLQQSISLLTGQVEQLQYRNNQLQQQLEKEVVRALPSLCRGKAAGLRARTRCQGSR